MKFNQTCSKMIFAAIILSIVPVFESQAMRRRNIAQRANVQQARAAARAARAQRQGTGQAQKKETSFMDFFTNNLQENTQNFVKLAAGAICLIFGYKLFTSMMNDGFTTKAKNEANRLSDKLYDKFTDRAANGFVNKIEEALFGKETQAN